MGPEAGIDSLSAPQDIMPFPVRAPVRVKPDLCKLENEPLFLEDREWPDWINEKISTLGSEKPAFLLAPWLTTEALDVLWGAFCRFMSKTTPHLAGGPVTPAGEFPWIQSRPRSAIECFLALSLSIQEDFALMVHDGQDRLSAGLLSVCFPSGWRPEEKIGRPLQEIHSPIPQNSQLQAATPAMAQAMASKGPFVRHVWTLAGAPSRRRSPAEDTLAHARQISDLWFRCERQVTVPLDAMGCLFLIRVFVVPLEALISEPEKKQALKEALLSMSEELIQYKGIDHARTIVLEACG